MVFIVGIPKTPQTPWRQTATPEEAWNIALHMAAEKAQSQGLDPAFARECYGTDPEIDRCGVCPIGDDPNAWPQINVEDPT